MRHGPAGLEVWPGCGAPGTYPAPCSPARTTYELGQSPGLGTTGQLWLVGQRWRSDYAVPAGPVIPCLVLVAAAQGLRPRQGVCLMSVPGIEPAQGAERAAIAAPGSADRWDDPRLPWHGKPRAADILCWLGIALSGLFFLVLLPLRVSLVGTHPVVAELLNGGPESLISGAALASAGDGTP